MFQTNVVEKIKIGYFMFNDVLPKSAVYESVGKYGKAGQATDDTIRLKRFSFVTINCVSHGNRDYAKAPQKYVIRKFILLFFRDATALA
jgi:hypothetical protein